MWRLPENSIVISAVGGLGNRLQALEGAIWYGRTFNKRVYLNWIKEELCAAPFHKLFESSESFKLIRWPQIEPEVHNRWGRYSLREQLRVICVGLVKGYILGQRRNRGQLRKRMHRFYEDMLRYHIFRFDREFTFNPKFRNASYEHRTSCTVELASMKRLYAKSYYRVWPPHSSEDDMYKYNYLRPKAVLRRRIERITQQFGEESVGIHIRRGDTDHPNNQFYTSEDRFIAEMRNAIAKNEKVKFYLATDSQAVRDHFKELFGERLVMQPNVVDRRDATEGIAGAIVDMYALAATSRIIASHSTFSIVAAQIGGIELHILYGEHSQFPNSKVVETPVMVDDAMIKRWSEYAIDKT